MQRIVVLARLVFIAALTIEFRDSTWGLIPLYSFYKALKFFIAESRPSVIEPRTFFWKLCKNIRCYRQSKPTRLSSKVRIRDVSRPFSWRLWPGMKERAATRVPDSGTAPLEEQQR